MPRSPQSRDRLRPRVLLMLSAGRSHADISRALGISSATVGKWALAEQQKSEAAERKAGLTPAAYMRGYRWFV